MVVKANPKFPRKKMNEIRFIKIPWRYFSQIAQ